jgi:hypothetical protein
MALNQTQLLTTLAYLLGERSVNATTSAPRADFIQSTLDEIYASHPWRFARANATLTISNGIATLPTNYDDNHPSFAKFGVDEVRLDPIYEDDSNQVTDGDKAMWITTTDSDDERYILHTKDTLAVDVPFRYQKRAPILDNAGTVTTPYPWKRTVALGARRDVKLGQNPDADISQDEKIFSKALSNNIATHQVPAPRKRRRSAQGQTRSSTGEF